MDVQRELFRNQKPLRCGIILIDFDNYCDFTKVQHNPKQHHIDIALEQLVISVFNFVSTNRISVNEIYFRFYGGWFPSTNIISTTDRYKMLASAISKVPRRKSDIRLNFKIVSSIEANTSSIFTNTMSLDPLYKRIHVDDENVFKLCPNPSSCTMHVIDEWFNKGCPAPCKLKSRDVLKISGQKTVDGTIICDLIYFSYIRENDFIGLVSGDYDLIPGIVYALSNKSRVILFRRNEKMHYDHLLDDCEIISNMYVNYKGA